MIIPGQGWGEPGAPSPPNPDFTLQMAFPLESSPTSCSRPVPRGQEAKAVGHSPCKELSGSLEKTPGCSWGFGLNLVHIASAGRTEAGPAEGLAEPGLGQAPKQSVPAALPLPQMAALTPELTPVAA